ncbi:aldehyde dehydrogenase family protein [Hoyosella subflava]|uniref:Putative aldehyde dehydrogenase (NAD(P)+) n=1 Tax=Hoyosella subflava (strain DSM 45089 / JCM 17490 / NBRC 109087 / DQS3-9A1) TaxID=443218 RepID=F6EHH0_HOYSD|nr:aldehyde dehydrogenase family protein [Hoyosella subflava]AEF41149.1 putative aldehyde dehydrogenase (NAD(P)+) [Hoyosella subflava DQS3-9A1]
MAGSGKISEPDKAHIDAALRELGDGVKLWSATPLVRRRELLGQVHQLAGKHAQEWVDAASTLKGLKPDSPLVGEEWISGPYPVLAWTTAAAETLAALEAGKSPLDTAKVVDGPGGRLAVNVLPFGVFDALLLNGFSAQVWLEPGVDRATAARTAGLAQLAPTKTNGIGAVLGAGNITSIAPLDVLYEIYAHNRVVILKLNPIMDGMFPVFSKVFRPLIDMGIVRIVQGGAEAGSYLVNHDDVAHVHITGSALTHDAIVFGAGDDAAKRKAASDPLLTKPITSELGGVSPVIVIPGKWSGSDLRFQAEHIATQRLHNGGYNCIAAQVVVLSENWAQKDEFLQVLREVLHGAPARQPYYPGSGDRLQAALDAHPGAERISSENDRVFITGIEPDSPVLGTEYFSPVLAVATLPGEGEAFFRSAVDFANTKCAGTLGANIIAHPATLKELGSGFDSALEELRYGTIAVNAWTGVGYLTARATWGAFPGHTLEDVQSGIGVVHNAMLLDRTERTVVHGPFRPAPRSLIKGELALSPRPPWFVTSPTAATTGRRLTEFTANQSWIKIPGIFASALRG